MGFAYFFSKFVACKFKTTSKIPYAQPNKKLKKAIWKKVKVNGTNNQRNEIILPEIKTMILDEKFSIILGATIIVTMEPSEKITKR